MAKLTCTIKEYHKFIGPRIKNMIQAMTKKRKMEAAHKKGKNRREIIEQVLKKYLKNPKKGIVQIDLEEIDRKIKHLHKPLDKYLIFLCAKCHKKYDDSNK
jgi:hypothetical protein